MKTAKITIAELVNTLIAMKDERDVVNFVTRTLSGTDNRFIRQNLILELTGEKHHLVKCGVSYVTKHVMAYAASTPNDAIEGVTPKAEKSAKMPALEIEVGTPVVRKQCKRRGVIKANSNGKMEIELEDGSIRKPASTRFYSLYNFQRI